MVPDVINVDWWYAPNRAGDQCGFNMDQVRTDLKLYLVLQTLHVRPVRTWASLNSHRSHTFARCEIKVDVYRPSTSITSALRNRPIPKANNSIDFSCGKPHNAAEDVLVWLLLMFFLCFRARNQKYKTRNQANCWAKKRLMRWALKRNTKETWRNAKVVKELFAELRLSLWALVCRLPTCPAKL